MPKEFKMLSLKQTQHTFPRIYTNARFYQWADWVLKDNQMLKKDGLDLTPKELDEARFERAIIQNQDIKEFVDKHCRIVLLDSNRKVEPVIQTLSYGIVMALDQMHLNNMKLK
jgi:hypothetical protein